MFSSCCLLSVTHLRPPDLYCGRDGTALLDPVDREYEIRLRSSEQVRELASIANKLAQRFKGANQNDFTDALARGDLREAEHILGLSEVEAKELNNRLINASESLLRDYPEVAELMPKRSLTDDPRVLARYLKRISPSIRAGSDLDFVFDPLYKNIKSKKNKSGQIESGAASASSAVNFFGDPDPEPCVDPPCTPGDPPPFPELEPPPDHIGTNCAYLPYAAALALCTAGGAAFYLPCATIALCSYCEGGWVDEACEP